MLSLTSPSDSEIVSSVEWHKQWLCDAFNRFNQKLCKFSITLELTK